MQPIAFSKLKLSLNTANDDTMSITYAAPVATGIKYDMSNLLRRITNVKKLMPYMIMPSREIREISVFTKGTLKSDVVLLDPPYLINVAPVVLRVTYTINKKKFIS